MGYQQAVLPVSLSGLGIKRCQDHKSSAFAASVLSSISMILKLIGAEVRGDVGDDLGAGDAPVDEENRAEEEATDEEERVARALITPDVLAALTSDMGEEEEVQLNVLMAGGVNQRVLARKIDENLHRKLVNSFQDSVRDQARIAGLCLPRTSDYLNCYPNRKLGIHLKSSEWCAVVKYRLNVPLYPADRRICPACGNPEDARADHALSCGSGGERIQRHNGICSAIHNLAVAGGLAPVREARYLLPNGRKPGDVMIQFAGDGMLDLALDISIVASLKPSMLEQCVERPEAVAESGYQRKMRSMGNQPQDHSFQFVPIVASCFGAWHSAAITQIKKLIRAKCTRLGLDEAKTTAAEFRSLSVFLQRGNGRILINRDIQYCEEPQIELINDM